MFGEMTLSGQKNPKRSKSIQAAIYTNLCGINTCEYEQPPRTFKLIAMWEVMPTVDT